MVLPSNFNHHKLQPIGQKEIILFVDSSALLRYLRCYLINTIGPVSPDKILCKSSSSFNELLDWTMNESGLSLTKEPSGKVVLHIDRTLEESQAILRFELLSSIAFKSSFLERRIRNSCNLSFPLLHSILYAQDYQWLESAAIDELVGSFESIFTQELDYNWLFANLDRDSSYSHIKHTSHDILNEIKSIEGSLHELMLSWKHQNSRTIETLGALNSSLFNHLKGLNAHSKDDKVKQVFTQFVDLQSYVATHSQFSDFQKLKKPMNCLHLYEYIIEIKSTWSEIVMKLESKLTEDWFAKLQQIEDQNAYATIRELHLIRSTEGWNDVLQYNIDRLLDDHKAKYVNNSKSALTSIEVRMSLEHSTGAQPFIQVQTTSGNTIDLIIEEANGRFCKDVSEIVYSSQLSHSMLLQNATIFAQALIDLNANGVALMNKDDIAIVLFDHDRNQSVEEQLVGTGYKSLGALNYDLLVESFVDRERSISLHHYKGLLNCNDLSNPVQQTKVLQALAKYGVFFSSLNLDENG